MKHHSLHTFIRLVITHTFAIQIHVAVAMYKVFCQKIQISIRTLHDFSIVTISEFVLLANRCMNPNVDFLIVASKLLIPKLADLEHDGMRC